MMFRLIILFATIFIQTSIFAQKEGLFIEGNVKNLNRAKTFYLFSVEGSKSEIIDSAKSLNNKVLFNLKHTPPTGEYYIEWDNHKYIPLVINNENKILFTTDNADPISKTIINISDENKIFYKLNTYQKNIDSLSVVADKVYESASIAQLDKIKEQIKNNVHKLQMQIKEFDKIYPNSFAVKIFKSKQEPNFKEYLEKNPDCGYNNAFSFFKRHFFDNIDKYDSNLVRTHVIYDACSFYLRHFTNPKTIENYIKTADFIISSFSWNNAQFDYVLNLLINTFESSGYDDVFIHLFETYMHSALCESGILGETERKVLSIKNLKKGTSAPELIGKDMDGNIISLKDFFGKKVLLMFWESSCPHCKQAIPHIREYMVKKTEIVFLSFSLDTIKQDWVNGIEEEKLSHPCISDLGGYDGANAIRWLISGTPSFFIIDANGNILAKPITLKALQDALK